MFTLNNVAVGDAYTPASTLGPVPTGQKVIYLVANASVLAQVKPPYQATEPPWSDEILITPQAAEFQKCTGIRFRNAVPGQIARVVAQLIEPNDVIPVGGTPFTQSLASTGAASGGAGMITGLVSAAGVITGGTGFTVNRTGVGVYVITYTTPFAAPPVVLVSKNDLTDNFPSGTTLNATTGCTVNFGGPSDHAFSFLAVPVA